MISGFMAAWQFLTIFPGKHPRENNALSGSLIWFPVVGLLQGLMLAGIYFVSVKGSILLASSIVIAAHACMRRFLHIDGFIDTVDGFAAGWGDKERMLAVMRKSDIGAFGAASVVMLIIIKIASIASLGQHLVLVGLLLFPVIGLTAAAMTASQSEYARNESGLGHAFISHQSMAVTLGILSIAIVMVIMTRERIIFAAALSAVLIATAIGRSIAARLDGHTGDTLGAIVEISETAFLAGLAIFSGWS